MRFPVALALLLTLTAAVYLPSVRAGYVYEDMRDAANVLTWPGWGAFLEQARQAPLRAVTGGLTHLNVAVFGIQPWALHLGNLLLHLVNVALFAWLLSRVMPAAGALAGAGVFALHPIQTEAVAYVSARGDLVGTLGVLLALHAATAGSAAAAVCAVVFAVLGKETAAVAWGLVPLWAVWTGARFPVRPWLLGGALALPLVAWGTRFDASVGLSSVFESLLALWRFLLMLVVPVGFSIEHDWRVWLTLYGPLLTLTLGVTWVAVRVGWERRSVWAFGWLWAVVAFAPRLLVPVYEGPHERHAYLLMVGWCFCAGHWLSGVTAPERVVSHG